MKLVIDIPEKVYEASQIFIKYEDKIQIPLEVIANGTPLPKGHGRLIDEKVIIEMAEKGLNGVYDLVDMPEYIAGLPAIIPEDKEGV